MRHKHFIPLLLALILMLSACVMESRQKDCWAQVNGKPAYLDANGQPVTGWQEIHGTRYYFNADGSLHTGWLEDGGHRYYMDQDGIALTGWQEIDGIRRLFGNDGILQTGWTELEEGRCYFSDDGQMLTGWLALEDGRYYLQGNGVMHTGWLEDSGRHCYFGPDGVMLLGKAEIDGKHYFFGQDGSMITGWAKLEDGTHYFGADGAACPGWQEIDGSTYYFHTDGAMAVGQTEIDGEQYFFNPHGQSMTLVNPWNFLPQNYTVDLVTVYGHHRVDRQCYDALMKMLSDCQAAGLNPVICSAYRTQEDQEFLFNRKVRSYTSQGIEEEEAKRLAGVEVAVPGTSEHQLGLAVDIVDQNNWMLDETQASMPTQIWLMEHCWEYGFILRFPNEKSQITGIIYEPWHYRYVGVEIALELRDSGLCLEEYLGANNNP